MRQVIDLERVNRNAMLANIASIGGLFTLLASVLLPLFLPKTATLSAILMIVGLGVSMVGIYFANRWVRKPRPEATLEKVLKGLGDGFVLFHYPHLPADHILLTPAGVTVLETVNLDGVYTYLNGKWKESMTIGRALRYIVEEHLGNPTQSAADSAEFLHRKLAELDGLSKNTPVKAVVVFTHPASHLDVKKPPIPVCTAEKLRKQVEIGSVKLPQSDYDRLEEYLESVTR
jgi:hypothetical protein